MGQLIVIVVFCCRIHLLLVLFLCHLKILTLWRHRWNPIAIMTAWHYIKLHQTTSHEITSCHATSYHTMGGVGGGTMPRHITTNFIISHHAPEHDTKPPHITSHVPHNITSYNTTPPLMISCHTTTHNILPHHITWNHIIPCNISWSHVTRTSPHNISPCHVTWHHSTPHQITSHHVWWRFHYITCHHTISHNK